MIVWKRRAYKWFYSVVDSYLSLSLSLSHDNSGALLSNRRKREKVAGQLF